MHPSGRAIFTLPKISVPLIVLFLFMLLLALAQAQTSVADVAITHLNATALDTGQVQISALVSVLDEEGQPAPGLTAADFTVQENGTPVETQALTVGPATQPLTLTLLIETSSSMARPGARGVPLDLEKAAAVALLEQLQPNDRVAVYEYNA